PPVQPASEERRLLQRRGGEASAGGQRRDPGPGRALGGAGQGLIWHVWRQTPRILQVIWGLWRQTRYCAAGFAASPSIQCVPSAACSFFQIGTDSLRRSIPHWHAEIASCRWGAATHTTTEASPISRWPVRCAIATRAPGQRSLISAPILRICGTAISAYAS